MLRHRVPNTNLTGRRQRHQLTPDEEQILDAHVQIERADVRLYPVLGDAPQSHLTAIGDGHHFALGADSHFRVYGHSFDHRLDVRTGEDVLPAGRVFQSVAGYEVGVRYRYPVVMGFYDLHSQRICPS